MDMALSSLSTKGNPRDGEGIVDSVSGPIMSLKVWDLRSHMIIPSMKEISRDRRSQTYYWINLFEFQEVKILMIEIYPLITYSPVSSEISST